jgi:mono/diheme cytochrome c family protein
MKKVLKWFGILIGGVLVLIILLGIGLNVSTSIRLNKNYEIPVSQVSVPNDSASIEHGAYIYKTTCAGCHGKDLSGTAFFNDPAIGSIPAPNLTSGLGGLDNYTSDQDYILAIRHGVSPEGKPLVIMPSEAFWYFSDQDLGSLIAYIKSVPALDNDLGERNIAFVGKILLGAGMFGDVVFAETIPHDQQPPVAPVRAESADYGEYLVTVRHCISCHGENLNGSQSPEPGAPFSPNLTPGGILSTWTSLDFITVMRTGNTPTGQQLDKQAMPIEEFGQMTDEDLTAIFMYLQSLPNLATPAK